MVVMIKGALPLYKLNLEGGEAWLMKKWGAGNVRGGG